MLTRATISPDEAYWIGQGREWLVEAGDKEVGPDVFVWLAPLRWAEHDRACETCDGERNVSDGTYGGLWPCPDCTNGRQRVELATECYCWDGMRLAPRDGLEPCTDCAVATVTVQVLPVMSGIYPSQPRCVTVCSDGSTWLVRGPGQLNDEITLPRVPVPGVDYVIRLVRRA